MHWLPGDTVIVSLMNAANNETREHTMTLRQRFEAVFAGRRPDAMAWYGDLTYWYFAHQKMGDLGEAWSGPRGIGQVHKDLRLGEYVGGCRAFMQAEGAPVRLEVRDEGDDHIVQWHTPVGELRQVQRYSPDSFSWGFTEHAVKSVQDLRVVRYIMEHRQYMPAPEWCDQVTRDYGDGGVCIAAVPGSPITELNKTWSGVMTLCYMLADEPDEVRKTLQAIGESQDRLWAITEQSACPYVMICENLSAETMGSYFDEFIAPYVARRMEGLHRCGKKALIHIDGKLRGVLQKVQATGVDCIDSVVPEPVGDVAIEDLRPLAGDKILLLGGLPGAMFAPPFAARDIERQVRKIIDLHKDTGRFMLGVADQVPPNGDLALVRLVSDLVDEYGRY